MAVSTIQLLDHVVGLLAQHQRGPVGLLDTAVAIGHANARLNAAVPASVRAVHDEALTRLTQHMARDAADVAAESAKVARGDHATLVGVRRRAIQTQQNAIHFLRSQGITG